MPNAFTFVIAFIVVLALIAGAAWLVRRFAGNRLGTNANRGRMPRLAVIDAAAVDGRRRLVLVRRDNVEHLLMIGGPTDIVVEPNIVRATPGRDQIPQRPPSGSEQSVPRLPPLAETGWAETDGHRSETLDHPESQMPEPRPARPPFVDAARRPAAAERRSDPLAGFTPEPMSRTDIRGARPARGEPAMPPRPPVRPTEPAPHRRRARPSGRHSRRPCRRPQHRLRLRPAPIKISPRWRNASRPRCGVRPTTASPKPRRRSFPNRRVARGAAKFRPSPHPHSEPSAAPPVAPPGPKSGFEHLEDEMASLLGRPKSPS